VRIEASATAVRRDARPFMLALLNLASPHDIFVNSLQHTAFASAAFLLYAANRDSPERLPLFKSGGTTSIITALDLTPAVESVLAQLELLRKSPSTAYGLKASWPVNVQPGDVLQLILRSVLANHLTVRFKHGEQPVTGRMVVAPSSESDAFTTDNLGVFCLDAVAAGSVVAPYGGQAKAVGFCGKSDRDQRAFAELDPSDQARETYHANECLRQQMGPANRKCVLLALIDIADTVPFSIIVDADQAGSVGARTNHRSATSDKVNGRLRPFYIQDGTPGGGGVGVAVFAEVHISPSAEVLMAYSAAEFGFDPSGSQQTWSQAEGRPDRAKPAVCIPTAQLAARQAHDWLLHSRVLRLPSALAFSNTVKVLDPIAFRAALSVHRPQPRKPRSGAR
jgi:hypothetical protein